MRRLSVTLAILVPAAAATLLGSRTTDAKPSAADCDRDGDGSKSPQCGGGDCDDLDPRVYPGNIEVCDRSDLDEDCDPRTFGTHDNDGDGYIDAKCCNRDRKTLKDACGRDCDDANPAVHPNQNEVCNQLDDNCDGAADEKVTLTMYEDRDGDLFGDPAKSRKACASELGNLYVLNGTDCDDADPRKNKILGCEADAPKAPKPRRGLRRSRRGSRP